MYFWCTYIRFYVCFCHFNWSCVINHDVNYNNYFYEVTKSIIPNQAHIEIENQMNCIKANFDCIWFCYSPVRTIVGNFKSISAAFSIPCSVSMATNPICRYEVFNHSKCSKIVFYSWTIFCPWRRMYILDRWMPPILQNSP